jgi:hypothetical protein
VVAVVVRVADPAKREERPVDHRERQMHGERPTHPCTVLLYLRYYRQEEGIA